ncbi:MAG: hypothetical protein EBY98_02100 [Acidimicrobiia bacterium]|nr:hypothetical protein [Acidimicrobiia bacterium]
MQSVWLARVTWLALAVVPGALSLPEYSGEALRASDDVGRASAVVLLWLAWAVVAFGMIVLHPLSLAAVRWLSPMIAIHVWWMALVADDAPEVWARLAAVGCALVVVVVMLRADFGARHVQAAAYGHERRHLLRPPVAVMLPSALVWLVAWALGAVALHVEPSIATAIAALASALLAAFGWRRVSVLARRWLVFVPAGIAVHDPLMLRDTFMVRRHDVRAVGLAEQSPSSDESFDITGTTWGQPVQITLAHLHDVSLSSFGARMTRTLDRVHVRVLRIAPTRADVALRETV